MQKNSARTNVGGIPPVAFARADMNFLLIWRLRGQRESLVRLNRVLRRSLEVRSEATAGNDYAGYRRNILDTDSEQDLLPQAHVVLSFPGYVAEG